MTKHNPVAVDAYHSIRDNNDVAGGDVLAPKGGNVAEIPLISSHPSYKQFLTRRHMGSRLSERGAGTDCRLLDATTSEQPDEQAKPRFRQYPVEAAYPRAKEEEVNHDRPNSS